MLLKLPSLKTIVSSAENVTQSSPRVVVNIADYYDMCRNECAPRKNEQSEVDVLPNVLLLPNKKIML